MKKIFFLLVFVLTFCTVSGVSAEKAEDGAWQQVLQAMDKIEKYKITPQGTVGKSELFGDATKLINSALSVVTDRPEYEFLASYIYRSRGVDSLAKQHFRKGCFMLERVLEKDPKDMKSHFEYAVALICGDTTYWENYKDYFHQGISHIKHAYDLTQGNTPDALYTRSIAEILTGDVVSFAISFRSLSGRDKGKYKRYIGLVNSCIDKNGWNTELLMQLAVEYLKNDFFGVKI